MGKHYIQLSLDERCEIYRLYTDGKSRRFIAKALGRSAATISRELRRNAGKKVGYTVSWAMTRTRARRRRKLYRLECLSALRDEVFDRLAMGWSPEQIAGRLKREHGRTVVSHESIYRYIYWRVNSHKENLHRCLPRARHRRGWRGRKGGSSARYIKARRPIHERPPCVDSRHQAGHWEGDLMLFSRYGQAALVVVERTSRFMLARKQQGKSARAVTEGVTALLAALPPWQKRSLTVDNGSEFSGHEAFPVAQTWFCDTHSPWQKGSVENAIGRLRRELPRKTDINRITPEDIDDIVLTYNMTPRKCLDFKTPAEVFLSKSNSVALET